MYIYIYTYVYVYTYIYIYIYTYVGYSGEIIRVISEATRKSTIYLIMLSRPDCKTVRWFGTTTIKLE